MQSQLCLADSLFLVYWLAFLLCFLPGSFAFSKDNCALGRNGLLNPNRGMRLQIQMLKEVEESEFTCQACKLLQALIGKEADIWEVQLLQPMAGPNAGCDVVVNHALHSRSISNHTVPSQLG